MQDLVSQIYAQSRSFFVSYRNKNENYFKSVTSTTWEIHIKHKSSWISGVACVRSGRGGGFEGGEGVERKWKRVAEKGDNEGGETQIGQNNILVGRFA